MNMNQIASVLGRLADGLATLLGMHQSQAQGAGPAVGSLVRFEVDHRIYRVTKVGVKELTGYVWIGPADGGSSLQPVKVFAAHVSAVNQSGL